MLTLNATLFGALPRHELNDLLQPPTLHNVQVSKGNDQALIRTLAEATFIQTLRSLTLPNPEPTRLIAKLKLPDAPMSYTQLKAWRTATILKLSTAPCPQDQYELMTRMETIRLLTTMECT